MQATAIFRHALMQVFGNLGTALKIFMWPLLLGVAAGAFTIGPALRAIDGGVVTIHYSVALIMIPVLAFAASWAGTAWHRHVLLNEPVGLFPKAHPREMLFYILQFLLISLAMIPLILVLNALLGWLLRNGVIQPGPLPWWLHLVLLPLVSYVGLRLGTLLPAISIGKARPSLDGWKMTKGKSGAIFVLAFMLVVIEFLLSFIPALIAQATQSLAVAIFGQMIVGALMGLVSISILTTLYGHYVEGRPLR